MYYIADENFGYVIIVREIFLDLIPSFKLFVILAVFNFRIIKIIQIRKIIVKCRAQGNINLQSFYS